jgi:hypothetical protein
MDEDGAEYDNDDNPLPQDWMSTDFGYFFIRWGNTVSFDYKENEIVKYCSLSLMWEFKTLRCDSQVYEVGVKTMVVLGEYMLRGGSARIIGSAQLS